MKDTLHEEVTNSYGSNDEKVATYAHAAQGHQVKKEHAISIN